MSAAFKEGQNLSRPPVWVLPLCAVVISALFVRLLPVGFDSTADILLEGLYLVLAVLLLVPVQRFGSAVVDIGSYIFILGRFIDFLDELFVEPEPIVEPYLSGLLMVISLSVLLAGFYSLVKQRDKQISDLADRTADLTVQNKVLENKTEELALKNRVIDEAPIGVTIADITQDNEPLIDVNDAFTRITGYDPSETLGRNCRFLQGDDTDPEKVAQMRNAIDNRESVQVTLRNYRKDGTLFWNEITLAPLPNSEGEITHYVGFQQDATDRKRFEQTLKSQRDNLEVLNQMLRHDIRNELQLVVGRAELLREHVPEDGPDHVDTIATAARDAVALTHTAQNLSEAMLNSESSLQPMLLSTVLREEIDDVASGFEDAAIRVKGDIPDIKVAADEMLNSVFQNLLRNAIQHNHKARPQVTVSTARDDGSVVVKVADDGPGIPDALKSEIFTHGEKGLESDGTGIGTYLVKTLVERYGGDVWIDDNEPEGTIFSVQLPIYESDD